MAISLSDLSPKAREQIAAKLAVEEAKKIHAEKRAGANKYHAEKVETVLEDGTLYTFASRKEAERYEYLLSLQRLGEISDLQLQVPYELIPKQKRSDNRTEKACRYLADFVYKDKDGNTVVEDTKGYKKGQAYAVFTIKRKLMLKVYGISIMEV